MRASDAVALIRPAVGAGPARWADLGAGDGTFTEAIATLLGEDGVVVAVDRDPVALSALRRLAKGRRPGGARIEVAAGDLTDIGAITELTDAPLDGALFANSLHFLAHPAAALTSVARLLGPGGRVVVVEYDRERPNAWVPHPLPPARLADAMAEAGLTAPAELTRRPSAYHRAMYCALAFVPGEPGAAGERKSRTGR